MQIGLGYILAYNPAAATVDIRTADGTTYPGLPYDANLAFYSTPVLPVFKNTPGTTETKVIKSGSFVLFLKFSDTNIRIIRIFNDDQDILKNYSGHTTRAVHGFVQDTLLATLQDGEALVMAPGRNIETKPGQFSRQVGSWMLFKNSGDAILSNANSSCEMFLSYLGQWEVTSTKYRVLGSDTSMQEQDDGSLRLAAGDARGTPVEIVLSKDGTALWDTGNTSVAMTQDNYSLSSGVINFFGGNEINLDTTAFTLAASSVDVTAETANIAVSTAANVSAQNLTASATNNVVVTAGTTMTFVAPKNSTVIGETGTTITLDQEATFTLIIGDCKLTMTKDGFVLLPPEGKKVAVGTGAQQKAVLLSGIAGQAPNGPVTFTEVLSKYLTTEAA